MAGTKHCEARETKSQSQLGELGDGRNPFRTTMRPWEAITFVGISMKKLVVWIGGLEVAATTRHLRICCFHVLSFQIGQSDLLQPTG